MDDHNFDSKDILGDAKIKPELDALITKIGDLVKMSKEELQEELEKIKKLIEKQKNDKNDAGTSSTEAKGNDQDWRDLFTNGSD